MEKKSYCDYCFIKFGTAEFREEKEGKVYHSCCLKRMEFQKSIVKEVANDSNIVICLSVRADKDLRKLGVSEDSIV